MGMLKLRFIEAYNIPVKAPDGVDLEGGLLVAVTAAAESTQSLPTVNVAGLGDDALGALEYDVNDTVPHGRRGSVATRGQMRLTSSGAVTAGSPVYPGAGGGVQSDGTGAGARFGLALTSAAAAGEEVLVQVGK